MRCFRSELTVERMRSPRTGVTLLELLIVITIIGMVTAASIPLMLSGAEGRRLRESARLVSSYFAAARSRAIETGRPAGVMVQRASTVTPGGSLWYSMNLVTVEVPPPYSGDTTASVANVSNNGNGTASLNYLGTYSGGMQSSPDASWQGLIRPGDIIKFNYQGRGYYINAPGGMPTSTPLSFPLSTPWLLSAVDGSGAIPSAAIAAGAGLGGGVPYQIIRQPTKSAVQPLQLPEGNVIDLAPVGGNGPAPSGYLGTSGVGSYVFTGGWQGIYSNPIVMFNPSGGIDSIYDGNNINPPAGPVYFLVGRRAGAIDVANSSSGATNNMSSAPPSNPAPPAWTPNNLYDLNNIWVSIGATTGLIATSENANIGTSGNAAVARAYAQSAQSMGGR